MRAQPPVPSARSTIEVAQLTLWASTVFSVFEGNRFSLFLVGPFSHARTRCAYRARSDLLGEQN
jgi:hypothetical protein